MSAFKHTFSHSTVHRNISHSTEGSQLVQLQNLSTAVKTRGQTAEWFSRYGRPMIRKKKSWSGCDSNPGRGVFSTFLMNAWCNSDKWHIRRCTILFHIERAGSGQNLESGSCAKRWGLIAVLWSPRGTHGRNLYAMLIERGQHAQLPTGQNRTEIGSVRAEKPQSPVSGHLEHVDCDFERIPLLAYGMNLRCLFIIV